MDENENEKDCGDEKGRRSKRLSGEEVISIEDSYPMCEKFQPPTKLPNLKSVLGRMRHLCGGGKRNMNVNQAVDEVAKAVYCKYYHDNVCCITIRGISKKIRKEYDVMLKGKYGLSRGREGKDVEQLKEQLLRKDKIFEVFLDPEKEADKEKIRRCQDEWGVKMTDVEIRYLEDQRSERKMECNDGVDPVWFRAIMRRQRMRELQDQEYLRQREEAFAGKSLSEIDSYLESTGELPLPSSPNTSVDTPQKVAPPPRVEREREQQPAKKRKLYVEEGEEESGTLPEQYRHIRSSERKVRKLSLIMMRFEMQVRHEVYQTYAALSGQGLSLEESSSAIELVGNGLFGRKWSKAVGKESFGKNTLPDKRNVIEALRQIEAQSLSLLVEDMRRGKEEGHMITLASDSTTRRQVGKFMGSGVHIGKEASIPLPLLGIGSETKEDIAQQLSMGVELLSICSGVSVKELMEQVDTLLTDSVDHNKGVGFILQELWDLDKPPGQLYCGTHTCLGFSSCMNRVVTVLETKMQLETVLSQFMVSMELDSKSGSLAGQALDMQLKLVAPEYKHKSWNYNGLYILYLEERNIKTSLFAFKDQRFGLLGRASAVLLHNFPHLESFLADHPHISNKLACLVRELMNLPHLKVIYSVFALLGVQLVEPYYSITIDTKSSHSSLKVFYQGLYDSLTKTKASDDFILLEKPHFPGVSDDLFRGVKESYDETVLSAVKEVALEHEEDVLMLINLMLPELGKTLGKQRRDYGLDEETFPVEFRFEETFSRA